MDTDSTYCEDDLSDISRCDSPSILQVFDINTSQQQCSNVVDEVSMNNEELIIEASRSTFCETPIDEINMSLNNDVSNEKNLENVQNSQDEYFVVNTDRYTHVSQSQDNFIISNKFIFSKLNVNKVQEETYSIEDEIPFSVIYTKDKIRRTRKTFRKKRTSKRIVELEQEKQDQLTNKHKYFLRPKKDKKINYNEDDAKTGSNMVLRKRKLNNKTQIDKKETGDNEDTLIVENVITLINNEMDNDIKSVTKIEEKTNTKNEIKRKNKAQITEESNNKTKKSHELELPIKPLIVRRKRKKTVAEKNPKNEQQIQESDNKTIDSTESELPTKLNNTGNTKIKSQILKNNNDKIDVGNNISSEIKLPAELNTSNCKNSDVKNDLKRKVKTRKTEDTNKKLDLENKTTLLTTNRKKPKTKRKRKNTVAETNRKNEQESDNKIIDLTEPELNSTSNEKIKSQKLKKNNDKIDLGSLELKLPAELNSSNYKNSDVKNDLKRKVKTRRTKETKKKFNLENKTTLLTTNQKKPETKRKRKRTGAEKNRKNEQESNNKIIDLTESELPAKPNSTGNEKIKSQKFKKNNNKIDVGIDQNKPETKIKRKRKTKIQKIEESNNKINVETKISHELELSNKVLRTDHKKIETNDNQREDIEQKTEESNKVNVETNISVLEYNDHESNKIISSQNFYIVKEMNVINNRTANELDFSDFLPDSPLLTDRGFETSDMKKIDDFIHFSQNSNSFHENEYFSQPYQDFSLNNYNEEVEMNDTAHEIQENNHIKNNTAHVDNTEFTLDIPLSLDLDTIDLVKSNEVVPFFQNSLSLTELDLSNQDFPEKSNDTHFRKALDNSNDNRTNDCNINKAKSVNLCIEISNSNINNVASKRTVRVLKEKYNDFTESQVENITFKVLEELSNVKNYLNKRERIFESSGSRYRYPIAAFNTGSQNSNSINESAHCLLQHITSSALVTHTEHITRQISIVLGNLIDKLHEEENYPNFLEKLLESVDNLLNYIYTGNNYEEYMLLKKEQAINRFFLLNRSSHIIQYSIQKITKILQETLENIKLGDFELKHTDKAENICHIFNILEILLNRHTKLRKNLSQHSSQMSQDDRVIKKSALTEIWRKKWNLCKSDVCEGSSQNNNFLTECSDVLNKITIEAMDGYSLISFAALQCYNLLQ